MALLKENLELQVLKSVRDELDAAYEKALKAFRDHNFPKLSNGMTPDEVKFSKEFIKAKAELEKAGKPLEKFNKSLTNKQLRGLADLTRKDKLAQRNKK